MKRSKGIPLVSVCIPCYNEGGNVVKVYESLVAIFDELREKYDFEIVFEDNASTDDTYKRLVLIAADDKRVCVIENSKNFGPMANGAYIMFQASGDAVIGMPCDLQVPVDLIPRYLQEWEAGFDVVLGRIATTEESETKYWARDLYYRIMNYFSMNQELDHVTGAGLFDRKAIDAIESLDDPAPNFRYLVTELGLKYKLIDYDQPARANGRSSYSFSGYWDQAVDSLVAVSNKPLRLITNAGVILVGLTFIFLLIAIVLFAFRAVTVVIR
jgi:glycosyltransferase involved in cell wall biosynthesis